MDHVAFRKHCELFPTSFTVTKEITGELKDILLQAAAGQESARMSLLSLTRPSIQTDFWSSFRRHRMTSMTSSTC